MIWLLACTSPQRADQDAYIASTTASRAEAAALCRDITDASLQADCLIHAAARHARAGDIDTAQATCQTIADAMWEDECWFLTADDAGLTGEAAFAACEQSGRFRPHCRGHALGRAVQAVEMPLGGEAKSVSDIGRLIATYRPRSAGLARRTMANELLATRVAERWAEAPFDPSLCGVLTPPMCGWAYRASLSVAAEELAGRCPGPVTSSAVQAIGLSGWTEPGGTVASAVWAGICQQVADGQPVDLKPAKLPSDLMPL